MPGGDGGAGDAAQASIQAANIAAKQAERSSKRAIKFLKEQDVIAEERARAGETRAGEFLAPTREAGDIARTGLLDLLGLGTEEGTAREISALDTPQTRFARQQAEKAQARSAAATTGLLSGTQLAAVEELGQNLANATFNQRFAQLQTLSGAGDVASTNLANIASRTGLQTAQQAQQTGTQVAGIETALGENLANLELAKGEARASGFLAAGQPGFFSGLARSALTVGGGAFAGAGGAAAGSALGSAIFG